MHRNIKIYEEEQARIIRHKVTELGNGLIYVTYNLSNGEVYTAIVELGDKLIRDINKFMLNPILTNNNGLTNLIENVKLFYRFNENIKYLSARRTMTRGEFNYVHEMSKILEKFKKMILAQIKNIKLSDGSLNYVLDQLENNINFDGSRETLELMLTYESDKFCANTHLLKAAIYGKINLEKWDEMVFGKVEETNAFAETIEALEYRKKNEVSETSSVRVRK